jgi:hypothetical protein
MKRRVALVVTGRLEFRGLAPALERLFPCAAFAVTSTLSEMDLKDSTSIRVDPTRNARDRSRAPGLDRGADERGPDVAGAGPPSTRAA